MNNFSFFSVAALTVLIGFLASSYTEEYTSKKVPSENFENLYMVSSDLFRCEQPSRMGMIELDSIGIKSVLNLRNRRNDKREAKGTPLNLSRIKINAWRMTKEDVVFALKEINKAKKPVVVHCLHGSDRTGAVVACYRMVFENWPRERALNEFLRPELGYHDKWFPKILELVKTVDIEELRNQVLN